MTDILVHPAKLNSSTFEVPGYKHASNVLIAASVAMENRIRITKVPDISDTKSLLAILSRLGATYTYESGTLTLDCSGLSYWKIPEDLSILCHGSIYLMPVILGKLGNVHMGQTGGCQIGDKMLAGARPISHMIEVLQRFGANFTKDQCNITGNSNNFRATHIDIMDFSDSKDILTGPQISGATKTAILAALFVKDGMTTILNPYSKPDVTELLSFIRFAGYIVHEEENYISIQPAIKQTAIDFELIDDISVVMTYITLAVYNNIVVKINLSCCDKVKLGLKAELQILNEMNISLSWQKDSLIIPDNQNIRSTNIQVTSIGIYSDHQPFVALLLTKAEDVSKISESVWKDRFDYATELNKLADDNIFLVDQNEMHIFPGKLNKAGQVLHAKELRGAAVMLIASLQTDGTTRIINGEHLERGYEDIVRDIRQLGANIQTESDYDV